MPTLNFYSEVDDTIEFSREALFGNNFSTTRKYKSVSNVAIGIEHQVHENFLISAGLFTDQSNVDLSSLIDDINNKAASGPEDEFYYFGTAESIDLYGFSVAATGKYEEYEATLGFITSWGDGQTFFQSADDDGRFCVDNCEDKGGVTNAEDFLFDAEQVNFSVYLGIQY